MKQYTAFGVYQQYFAIKQHLTNAKYDYRKYRGNGVRPAGFNKRPNDQKFFDRIGKRHDMNKVKEVLIAEIVHSLFHTDSTPWIGTIDRDPTIWEKWKQRLESIHHVFQSDLQTIIDASRTESFDFSMSQFAGLFLSDSVSTPIYVMAVQGKITLETVAILERISGLLNRCSPEDGSTRLVTQYGKLLEMFIPEVVIKQCQQTLKDMLLEAKG